MSCAVPTIQISFSSSRPHPAQAAASGLIAVVFKLQATRPICRFFVARKAEAANIDGDRRFETSHQPNSCRPDRHRGLDSCENSVRHRESAASGPIIISHRSAALRWTQGAGRDPTIAVRMSPMRNSRPAFEDLEAGRSKERAWSVLGLNRACKLQCFQPHQARPRDGRTVVAPISIAPR